MKINFNTLWDCKNLVNNTEKWNPVSSVKLPECEAKTQTTLFGRFYLQGAMISQTLKTESMLKKIYSGLPHKRVHPNKQAGRGNFESIT